MRSSVRIALSIAAVMVALSACGGDERAEPPSSNQITFESWDEFGAAGRRAATANQVVFIGLDGGVWHYVNRLIENGHLPNLARIKKEGAFGTLLSTENYVSPPAWTTMMTGYLPHQTGIYTFGHWNSDTQEFLSASSDDVAVPSVWDAASRAGKKVGVVNVPVTYPPHPVNGIMVTGLLTPIEVDMPLRVQGDATIRKGYRPVPGVTDYSPPLRGALTDPVNTLLWVVHDTKDDGKQRYDKAAVRVIDKTTNRELAFVTCNTGEFTPWMKIRFPIGGKLQSAYTKLRLRIDPDGRYYVRFSPTIEPIDVPFTYPDGLAARLDEEFGFYLPSKFLSAEVVPSTTKDATEYALSLYDYDDWDFFAYVFTHTDNIHHVVGYTDEAKRVYQVIDGFLGELMEKMPRGSTLVIGSDHGFGQYERGVDPNQMLARIGLLEYEVTDKPRIVHEKTLVFHNLWHLYFNHELISRETLAERGFTVPEGEDPEDFLFKVVSEAGLSLTDPDGNPMPIEMTRLPGVDDPDAPDAIVKGTYASDYMVQFWNIMSPKPTPTWKLVGSEKFWHIREGIMLMWGDHVRRGFDAGVQDIQNIAPTMAYVMGVPVAPDMDGHVMTDVFRSDFVGRQPIIVNNGYRDIPKEIMIDPDNRESLAKKLRSLGYIQ